MSRTRSEMIRMTSHKFPGDRNTSYYGVQVVCGVQRLRGYCKSSKTTEYAHRAVVCVSSLYPLFIILLSKQSTTWKRDWDRSWKFPNMNKNVVSVTIDAGSPPNVGRQNPKQAKSHSTVSESYNSMDITSSSDTCLSLHHVYNTEEFKLCDCKLIQRNFAP
jgi:hypothetical protein